MYVSIGMILSLFRTSAKEGISSSKREQPQKSIDANNILVSWFQNMFISRPLMRRGRQRRVLSKHIRRTNSINGPETQAKTRVPRYIYIFVIAVACCFISFRMVAILSSVYAVYRKMFLPFIRFSLRRLYKRPRQHSGPTLREKWYYYVDYWISTNPYVQEYFIFFVFLEHLLRILLTSGVRICASVFTKPYGDVDIQKHLYF